MKQPGSRQRRLATLLKSSPGLIRVDDAIRSLKLDREHASKLLAGWHRQGVLRRVAHGIYVPVQPSALEQVQVLGDPWVLVPELYEPGYIGGWSALEHWELTEQLFRSICVLTAKRTTYGEMKHQGVGFFVKHIPKAKNFGTKTIWRDNIKIKISDPHKTILDIINDVNLGAGLQHSIDCIKEFLKTYNKQSDLDLLLDYAIKIKSGALFKKLGYLAEQLEFNTVFINECHKRLTQGYAYLDKKSVQNNLITRWKLWVPSSKAND